MWFRLRQADKKQRARQPPGAVFRSGADIIPDPDAGILRVRVLGTAGNAGDARIGGLLDELAQTNTIFPGTNLRMICELLSTAGWNRVNPASGRGPVA